MSAWFPMYAAVSRIVDGPNEVIVSDGFRWEYVVELDDGVISQPMSTVHDSLRASP